MQQAMLFGLTCAPARRRAEKRRTSRTQYRRESWEDAEEPSVSFPPLFGEVPKDVLNALPVYLRPLAEVIAASLNKAVKLPDGTSEENARAIMSVVYYLRWHARSAIRIDGDHETVPDYVTGLTALGRFYREAMLAEKGFRHLAHGVFRVNPRDPASRWRVQIWDTSKEKRNSQGEVVFGGKLHICYTRTEDEGWNKLAEWYLRNRGEDARRYVCYSPGSAIGTLLDCVRDAAAMTAV